MIQYTSVLDAIKAFDTIIIHRHKSPDGDALGSQIGLKHIILENFPGKTVYTVGDSAGRYSFMADSVMDEIPDSAFENALSIILDTSAAHLISDDRYKKAKFTCRIDHHLFVEKIAEADYVDSSSESCAGLIVQMAMDSSLTINALAASSLYTGMATDSGRFRYDSTSSDTMRRAAFLLDQKIDISEIYRNLYASDFDQLLLRARYTLKIQFTENRVAYIITTKDELKETNADIFAISRGMVGLMGDIKGVDIWANFTETDKGVLCELRSDKYNINPVAVKYGGGGHKKASGATLESLEKVKEMLHDLDQMAKGN
ncbi:MAG: bifunctional oligoribonuclease/PAP phosphatase NrnA [Clostridia bacterium]|nr:bifunctional oligoribonuclease/PAP phosphatase NrnA [Clostridia bacterium]